MGMLDRVVKNAVNKGINNAVGKAVESSVRQVVQPAADRAANAVANAAVSRVNTATAELSQSMTELNNSMAEANAAAQNVSPQQWNQAFSFLEGMATSAAMDMKECPKCGQVVRGAVDFCPYCGGPLPKMTMGQGALCPNCGRQNTPGMKFCVGCGTKLPSAVAEEEATAQKDAGILNLWMQKYPAFPVWNCGGSNYEFEEQSDYLKFSACFESDYAAQEAVNAYRQYLKQYGFREAGQYPGIDHLYNMINGVCYHVDTEHCFDGNGNSPDIYFNIQEPVGGFNYVKPEPQNNQGFLNRFGVDQKAQELKDRFGVDQKAQEFKERFNVDEKAQGLKDRFGLDEKAKSLKDRFKF